MTVTLAAPTTSTRKRVVTFRWVTKVDGPLEKGVDVTVAQYQGNKVMTARANVTTFEQSDGWGTVSFAPLTGVLLAREPAARFNQKRLEEFAQTILAALPEYLDASEKFTAMFDPEWSA